MANAFNNGRIESSSTVPVPSTRTMMSMLPAPLSNMSPIVLAALALAAGAVWYFFG